jgi:glycosyltransferase involved in cell wall biosynthesis
MQIWFVQTTDPTVLENDTRIGRTDEMINAALNDNHSVTRWTSTFDHFSKRNKFKKKTQVKISSKYKINFVYSKGYKSNFSITRYLSNLLLSYSLYKEFKESNEKPDLIIVSFPIPEVAFLTIYFAKLRNINSIVDVRDLWPDTIIDKFFFLKPLVSVLLIPMRKINNYIFSNATAIIGNSDQFIKWGIARAFRRKKSNLDIAFKMGFSNLSYKAGEYEKAKKYWQKQKITKKNNFLIASFFGTIGYNFDFDLILETAKICDKKKINIKFILCGDGPRLKELIKKTQNMKNILLTGWLNYSKIKYINHISDIGLAPYLKTENFINNLTNKIAEYMCEKNAIALSLDKGIMYELIKKYKCGFVYSNAEEFAQKIFKLVNKPKTLKKMKQSSFNLYKDRFNSSETYKGFEKYIKNFD